MTRIFTALLVVAFLSSCGGGSNRSGGPVARSASGPIATACLQAGRKAASRERCGCVQSVANASLSSSDQRRGASFFSNPQSAQDIRQSDNASNEAFWKRWKAFGAQAAKVCS
ncbi:hypothetical protein ACXYMO_17615 [Arenibacterium sp. CAU 1754]